MAGCAGKKGDESGYEPSSSTGPEAQAVNAPQWALRDYWIYESEATQTDYVISGEMSGDWILDTSNPETAFADARSDISRLGPVRKSDLAGSQGADRVEFFKWPLTPHDNWTTRWDGQAVTMHNLGPDGKGVHHFEARNATGLFYSYSYDPKAEWLGEVNRHDADGAISFSLKLKEFGYNYTGLVVRYSLDTPIAWSGPIDATPQAVTFPVAGSVTDVFVQVSVTCTAGAYALATGVVQGQSTAMGGNWEGPCPATFTESRVLADKGTTDETWGALSAGAPQSVGTYALTVWERTLTTIPVPAPEAL